MIVSDSRNDKDVSRRDFLKSTGVTAAGLAAASLVGDGAKTARASAKQSGRILGANDRINYAILGVGGMGSGHLHILKNLSQQENIAVVAVCDVFDKRRARAKDVAQLADNRVYTDYRRMLQESDIDVVVIASPDHWHAPMAIDSMEAGKHIYIEKPMTHTLDEAFKVYDTAKRTNRSVQVGSHGCSDPKWHKARDVIADGKLGKLLWAQGSYCRNNVKGEWNYEIEPEATE
jgi:predicted dehydrogenase